jgi:hypothetical protein
MIDNIFTKLYGKDKTKLTTILDNIPDWAGDRNNQLPSQEVLVNQIKAAFSSIEKTSEKSLKNLPPKSKRK